VLVSGRRSQTLMVLKQKNIVASWQLMPAAYLWEQAPQVVAEVLVGTPMAGTHMEMPAPKVSSSRASAGWLYRAPIACGTSNLCPQEGSKCVKGTGPTCADMHDVPVMCAVDVPVQPGGSVHQPVDPILP
jgi:hypothetical protein